MTEIKKKLLIYCITYADERIKNAKEAIISARDASSNDTKSSAGDKYETTREMMQQEVSRQEKQLMEAQKLKHALSAIKPEFKSTTVQPGSLVTTDNGNFFISISAGQVVIDQTIYFAISPVSPIGAKLIGLKQGNRFQFNGKDFAILDVS
jgi:transcription elongation GreA/GreB family factor